MQTDIILTNIAKSIMFIVGNDHSFGEIIDYISLRFPLLNLRWYFMVYLTPNLSQCHLEIRDKVLSMDHDTYVIPRYRLN